jgi:hypothetical protein
MMTHWRYIGYFSRTRVGALSVERVLAMRDGVLAANA